MRFTQYIKSPPKRKQVGVVLVLMAFIIGLATTAYLLKSMQSVNAQTAQEEQTHQSLKEAKLALIGWSTNHYTDVVNETSYIGQMPFPDRNSDGNYDGYSDCNSPASTFSYGFLIGKLPVYGQHNPCITPQTGLGTDYRDAQGNRLWYAVSRNLVHKYEASATLPINPVINPSIINNPTYPWLKVLDASGHVMSDRVAAVIIAPGNILNNQNRQNDLAESSQYLDELQLNELNISNADYTKPDEDFINAPNSQSTRYRGLPYQPPYHFNDLLVYITIDELMATVTARAAADMKHLLNKYRANNAKYPNSATLGAALNNHVSQVNSQQGMLPIDVTDTCACTTARSCSCSFGLISTVTFTRGSSTAFTANSGSCTRSGTMCNCTGAGSCSRGTRAFSCTSAGLCTHNINGTTNRYDFTAQDFMDTPSIPIGVPAGCTIVNKKARCNGAGSFHVGLKEPTWFKTNAWQDYFYYEWSAVNNIQAGLKTGISALLVGVGEPIQAETNRIQGRPSADIRDYLDSIENTNGDLVFDATNKAQTEQYNDLLFLVYP